jgi:hypothetical protein
VIFASAHKNIWDSLCKNLLYKEKQALARGKIREYKKLKQERLKLYKKFETSNLYHVIDLYKGRGEEWYPSERRVARSGRTLKRIIEEAYKKGYIPLYRGVFYISREVWKEYKQRYKEVKENKRLTFQIFAEGKLVRVSPYVLIDLDNIKKEDIKRLVRYLHKLGIYPEVWKSASGKGYHIYIYLIYQVVKVEKDKYYEFPYASDWRIDEIVKALKELLAYLNIPFDSVSSKRSVWLEGFPNPIKGGNRSKKVFEGAVHRIDKVYQKLLPLIERMEKRRITKRFVRKYIRRNGIVNGSRGIPVSIQIEGVSSSNPVDYIQINLGNGNINRLLNAGYSLESVGEILEENYQGDKKAFERAWCKAKEYIEANHIPSSEKLRGKQGREGKKKRKHKHYWEHIPVIAKYLKKGITSINGIHRRTGISKGTLSHIFRMVSREQILENPVEVMNYLKSIQKGGDRLSEEAKEKARERGKERFRKYMEEELKKALASKKKEKRYCLLRKKELVREPLRVKLNVDFGYEDLGGSNRSNIYYSSLENGRVVVGKSLICLGKCLERDLNRKISKGIFECRRKVNEFLKSERISYKEAELVKEISLSLVVKGIPKLLFGDSKVYLWRYKRVKRIYSILKELEEPVTAKELSRRLGIPVIFVRFLLKALRDEGVIGYKRKGRKGIMVVFVKSYVCIVELISEFLRVYYYYKCMLEDYFETLERIKRFKDEESRELENNFSFGENFGFENFEGVDDIDF